MRTRSFKLLPAVAVLSLVAALAGSGRVYANGTDLDLTAAGNQFNFTFNGTYITGEGGGPFREPSAASHCRGFTARTSPTP